MAALLRAGTRPPPSGLPLPLPPFQPLTDGHMAIALEADALVLVALNPSGLLRGAVLWVDAHAGVALDAAEGLRVGRWQEHIYAQPAMVPGYRDAGCAPHLRALRAPRGGRGAVPSRRHAPHARAGRYQPRPPGLRLGMV